MSEHLSNQIKALTALTFSDWLLRGVDENVLESLLAMAAVLQQQTGPVAKAARKVAQDLQGASADALARAWTRAFCVGNSSVVPHESVALTGLVMQQPRDEVLEIMQSFGLTPEEDIHEPADHLGVMLAFWSRLLSDTQTTEAARSFANKHLGWVPWIRRELCARQPDNHVVLSLLILLEAFLEDYRAEIDSSH